MTTERAGEIVPGNRQHASASAAAVCRNEIDRAAVTAYPLPQAGSASRRWLMLAAEMVGLVSGSWRPAPDPAGVAVACRARIAMRALGADVGSVRAARTFTAATLRRWGAAQRSQDITIVVSELLANALRHALPGPGDARNRRPIRLGLLQRRPWVLCAVADPSNAVPVPQVPDSFAEGGRGLQMICALSDRWGYTSLGDSGKVVWAVFYSRPPISA